MQKPGFTEPGFDLVGNPTEIPSNLTGLDSEVLRNFCQPYEVSLYAILRISGLFLYCAVNIFRTFLR